MAIRRNNISLAHNQISYKNANKAPNPFPTRPLIRPDPLRLAIRVANSQQSKKEQLERSNDISYQCNPSLM